MSNRVEPIRSVKGTRDLLPAETWRWQKVENEARRVFGQYNFQEIRTPVLEHTELFARSVGAETDIVSKEMYSFEDHERQDLAELRAAIRSRQPSLGNDLSLKLYEDQIRSFQSRLGEAIKNRQVPKTLENERVLSEVDPFLNTLWNSWAGGDIGRFNIHVGGMRERLDSVRLGDSLTLRPEATASVVRAYIEHSLFNEGGIHKLYYMGPMFRRERPQKGRFRQFAQIGAEVLGADHPAIDAEVLEMLVRLLDRLGLHGFPLHINSVGCVACRQEYLKTLRQALENVKGGMCEDCRRRAETNPLRVFDCKVETDQPIIEKLPHILDHLCLECRQHFESVKAELKQREINFEIEPRLVRGLDYYTRTTFEITSGGLGAQNALLGGGRYDGLSEMLGGPPTPGFGFAIGEDRLVMAVELAAVLKPDSVEVFIAWMTHEALSVARQLARELRGVNITVEMPFELLKLKRSLGLAGRLQARFALIVGENEIASGRYQVKDMSTGQQEEIGTARLAAYLKEKLGMISHPV